MSDRIPIIVNREGGTAAAAGDGLAQQIEEACSAAGCHPDLQLVQGSEIAAAVEAKAHHPRVIVGGGDGTLGSAAGVLIRGGKAALGILPLGTRNHLAQQLGIPADLPEAVTAAVAGTPKAIDVATANGIVFLNNASIGFYPLMVRWRDEERRRRGFPKWIANLFAGQAVLRRLKHHRLRVETDGAAQSIRTPLLFVGNNLYSLEGGHIGERIALDDGKLSLFAVATGTRLQVLWFGLRTMVGRSDPQQDFAALETGRHIIVSAHATSLHVALDGEVQTIATPLRFDILPRALRVVVPADKPGPG